MVNPRAVHITWAALFIGGTVKRNLADEIKEGFDSLEKSRQLNIYIGKYIPLYGEKIFCVISAESEQVALGLALQDYPKTNAKDWLIEEFKSDKQKVDYIWSVEDYYG